jgi:hypothetical protein
MELHVKDEAGRARTLPERRRIGRLDLEHVEEPSEHRVHGQERRRHPAASPQEVTAAHPEPRRQTARPGEDPVLHRSLGGRLREGRELLVGDEPRRERRERANPPSHAGADLEGVAVLHRHGRLLAEGADEPVFGRARTAPILP